MTISQKVAAIEPSITLMITARARQMKQAGIDVISFGAGEPDFDTPVHIKQAAIRAIEHGFTKYTPAAGIIELKQAICNKLNKDNNLEYTVDQVIISCGAKHALFNAMLTLVQEGDEVILPAPFWVSYVQMITVVGAKAVIIPTSGAAGFKITPQQLSEAITSKSKLFILNSPSNPTGAVYTHYELEQIANILLKHNIICLSDEIYEKIIYDNIRHISIASLGKEIKKLTVVVNGVSKAYAMTGWRIGYSAADSKVVTAMGNLQGHSTSNPASISQKAALSAIAGPQNCVKDMVEKFWRRRDFIVKEINNIKRISCFKPTGAFYLFTNIKDILGKYYHGIMIKDSLVLTRLLLENAKIAVVPGAAFGDDRSEEHTSELQSH